jgi:hypothetical protein
VIAPKTLSSEKVDDLLHVDLDMVMISAFIISMARRRGRQEGAHHVPWMRRKSIGQMDAKLLCNRVQIQETLRKVRNKYNACMHGTHSVSRMIGTSPSMVDSTFASPSETSQIMIFPSEPHVALCKGCQQADQIAEVETYQQRSRGVPRSSSHSPRMASQYNHLRDVFEIDNLHG